MAGLVTVTTPVTATTISSTLFGIPVATNLGVLANPPLAKMRNSVGQSVANATAVALTWDTEDFDTANGHSTVTNTSRYTCQTGYAGRYRVRAVTSWVGNATGVRLVWFRINGVDVNGSEDKRPATASGGCSVCTETIVTLAATDFVEAFAQQNSGGALSTSTPSAAEQSWFEVQWISQ